MSELGDYSTSFKKREVSADIKKDVSFRYFNSQNSVISPTGELSQTTTYEGASTIIGLATPVASGSDKYFLSFEIMASHPQKSSVSEPIHGVIGENLLLTAQFKSGDLYASLGEIQEGGLRKIQFKDWRKIELGNPKKEILKTIKIKGGQPQAERKADLAEINFRFI